MILLHHLILCCIRVGCLVKHSERRNIDYLLVRGGHINISVATVHKLPITTANGKVLSAIRKSFIRLALGGVTILPDVRYTQLAGSRSTNSLLGSAATLRTIFLMKVCAKLCFINYHDVIE